MYIGRAGGARSRARLLAIPLLVALLTAGSPAIAVGAPVTPANPSVVIDPGHGGVYPGAVYGGVTEADLNLQISRRLAEELARRGIGASMTRTGDVTVRPANSIPTWRWDSSTGRYIYRDWGGSDATSLLRCDLQQRANIGNRSRADVFVSIHCNAAGSSSANGAETYWASNDPAARQLALDVQAGVVARTGARNRGAFSASFYVLRWSNQPAILLEAGFMSNPAELARLRDPAYQRQVAAGVADGLQVYFKRPVNEGLTRYAGADRYETAASLVRARYPSADTVILASGDTYADSLVATPLAAARQAPILTASRSVLPDPTRVELARLRPRTLIVVGGSESVSNAVLAAAANAAGLNPSDPTAVRRVAGPDRYATALAVAHELGAPAGTGAVLASGMGFADALSVAASAAARNQPILLTNDAALQPEVRAYILNGGTPRVLTVVGGQTVIPQSVVAGLPHQRLGGADRFETNWQVFSDRYTNEQRRRPVFVSGTDFPDALVAGPWAAREGRPLLLVGNTRLPESFRPWYYANHAQVSDPVVVGGPAAVSAYLEPMLRKMKMQ